MAASNSIYSRLIINTKKESVWNSEPYYSGGDLPSGSHYAGEKAVLRAGELGIAVADADDSIIRMKLGDGTHGWKDLKEVHMTKPDIETLIKKIIEEDMSIHYSLPAASATTLGGVVVDGLTLYMDTHASIEDEEGNKATLLSIKNAATDQLGVVMLSSSVEETSETKVATAKQLNDVYVAVNKAQGDANTNAEAVAKAQQAADAAMAHAKTKVEAVTLEPGSVNGTVKLGYTIEGNATSSGDIQVAGIDTAAYHPDTYFALKEIESTAMLKAGGEFTGNVSFVNKAQLFLSQDPESGPEAATKRYVDNMIATADALIFRGTLGDGGTTTSLPSFSVDDKTIIGDTYKVVSPTYVISADISYSGTEVTAKYGDLIIATSNTDGDLKWIVISSGDEIETFIAASNIAANVTVTEENVSHHGTVTLGWAATKTVSEDIAANTTSTALPTVKAVVDYVPTVKVQDAEHADLATKAQQDVNGVALTNYFKEVEIQEAQDHEGQNLILKRGNGSDTVTIAINDTRPKTATTTTTGLVLSTAPNSEPNQGLNAVTVNEETGKMTVENLSVGVLRNETAVTLILDGSF